MADYSYFDSANSALSAEVAKDVRIGIVVSTYNGDVTTKLLNGSLQHLASKGIDPKNIKVEWVPGAYELPLGAVYLQQIYRPQAILCLGCVITGDTTHDQYINTAVANGLMELNMRWSIPVTFGVLTPQTQQQAEDRAGGKKGNKGIEVAEAALSMLALAEKLEQLNL